MTCSHDTRRGSLHADEVAQLSGDDKFFVWGCQPSLKNRWDSMQYGDYVLFYAQGRFISVGTLKFKKMSEELALSLWPKSKESGEPWSCVFFVENINPINLPLDEFDEITGYSLRALQGFMRVSDSDALARINKRYGSNDAFISSLVGDVNDRDVNEIITIASKSTSELTDEDKTKLDTLTRDRSEDEIEAAIKLFAQKQKSLKPEQITKLSRSYKRNMGMVNALKEKYKNKCQICGFTFMTSTGKYYSEAAHIIPISDATEGVDSPDNIWILCANHHKMLDRGAIESTSHSTYKLKGVIYTLKA